MKVVFLGTNGWYSSETGHTTCILLDTTESYVILDAGSGIYKITEHIRDNKPIFLFLSHFHFDHICGLHILNKFNFDKGLVICCYKGGRDILNTVVRQPYTLPFERLSYKVVINELEEGYHNSFPFKVECRKLVHATDCLGYRFEFGTKVITFCTDTGYCNSILKLSKNADLLMAECALASGQKSVVWPHLNPEEAAEIAKRSNVKRLALVHFDAVIYNTMDKRRLAEKRAKEIFESVVIANDGMVLEI